MTDSYVIVYRDGFWSQPIRDKNLADSVLQLLKACAHGDNRPAYRIRIREKNPYELHLNEADWRTVNCLPKRAQS
jgi:hypothetical protein